VQVSCLAKSIHEREWERNGENISNVSITIVNQVFKYFNWQCSFFILQNLTFCVQKMFGCIRAHDYLNEKTCLSLCLLCQRFIGQHQRWCKCCASPVTCLCVYFVILSCSARSFWTIKVVKKKRKLIHQFWQVKVDLHASKSFPLSMSLSKIYDGIEAVKKKHLTKGR